MVDHKKTLPERLVHLFADSPGALYKVNEISKMVGIKSTDTEYQELRDTLRNLESEGAIIRGTRRRYGAPAPERELVEGALKMLANGNGVVVPVVGSGTTESILIRARKLRTASTGDTVRVSIAPSKKGQRLSGEVVEILKRSPYQKKEKSGSIAPHSVNSESKKRKSVDLVEHETLPEKKSVKPRAAIRTAREELASIITEYDLPTEFSPKSLAEVSEFSDTATASEIRKRLDLRKEIIFTIDPEDAKDFDDAVSLTTEGSHLVLGVHIADVSHFVTEGSGLDEDALLRGTSVYLLGGVVPMLPEKISNVLCSLRPDEDKFAFSVFMTVDPETGMVLKSEFHKTIIRSVMRFTYAEAEQRITTGRGKFAAKLREMRQLSERMYALRHAEGSIDFETSEVAFKFDMEGNPIECYKKERLGSMRMIEDFMLAANRAVAEFVNRIPPPDTVKPMLYRVHGNPDPEKLRELSVLAKSLGYRLNIEQPTPKTIQHFLDSLKGAPEEKLLNAITLRTMAKAVYSEKNIGHFGLAFGKYTHFTSPIRRYPDLLVHRMLAEYLKKGGMASARMHHYRKSLPEIANASSLLERRATEAERDSAKVAQTLLMQTKVGEIFEAVITGVTHFGLFVELASGAEGLVHVRELPGHYIYDESHYSLNRRKAAPAYFRKGLGHVVGRDRYRMGDPITVQLLRVRVDRREIDFIPA